MPSPLTLAYLQREGLFLRTWCSACGTGGADLDPAPLIERYGAAMTIEAVTARLRCRRCGARAAETRVAVNGLRMGLKGE
jgi:ribosomal protein L37E